MKKIIPLIFFCFINACASFVDGLMPDFISANDFVNRFPDNKKGIVILKINSYSPTTSWCQSLIWIEKKPQTCFDIKSQNHYQALMLEPGWYEIIGYETFNTSSTRIYLRNHLIQPQFSPISGQRKGYPFIAFEVAENKINFIGDIKFNGKISGDIKIVDDDFETIKNAFRNNDIELLWQFFGKNQQKIDILARKKPNIGKNLAKSKNIFNEEKKINDKIEKNIKKQQKMREKLQKIQENRQKFIKLKEFKS